MIGWLTDLPFRLNNNILYFLSVCVCGTSVPASATAVFPPEKHGYSSYIFACPYSSWMLFILLSWRPLVFPAHLSCFYYTFYILECFYINMLIVSVSSLKTETNTWTLSDWKIWL